MTATIELPLDEMKEAINEIQAETDSYTKLAEKLNETGSKINRMIESFNKKYPQMKLEIAWDE